MKKPFRVAVLILTLCMLVFIWGNSVLPKGQSDGMSKGMLHNITKLVPLNATEDELNHIIRKLAHFSEFAFFGVLICLLFLADPDVKFIPLSLCFATAICDETIQIFSGRGPSITDVMIDTAGAAFGIAVLLFIVSHVKRRSSGKV